MVHLDNIIFFILVGFIAQIVDGSLGMAYGVSSNSLLLTLGVSPAVASASVHTAEVFTTLASSISHWKFGNIDKQLIKRLVIPGVLGGIVGAYILTNIDSSLLKPIISIYLGLMGFRIIFKVFVKNDRSAYEQNQANPYPVFRLGALGLLGGFFDAIGGGGWGPIVTTTLISTGKTPRTTIGSVNLSEFFITFAEAVTFLLTIGLTQWNVIAGLLIGGIAAAPLGAFLTRIIPAKLMMLLVGILIVFLSIRTILLVWVL